MASPVQSLLGHARYHGLAVDHRAVDLDLSAIFDAIQGKPPDHQSSIAPPIPLPREAMLRLRKSELQLLAASLQTPPPPSWDEILPDPRRLRNLKVEVPLLTGHDSHLRSFSRRPSLDLRDFGVFSNCTDSPAKLFDLASEWDMKLSQEKLQTTKEDLMYLQHVLQDPYTAEEYQQVLDDALPNYSRKPFLDDEEIEMQEDSHLQDLQTDSLPPSQMRLPSPPFAGMLRSSCQHFSATRSLLGFMSTRGDSSKRLKFTGHHFSQVHTRDGKGP